MSKTDKTRPWWVQMTDAAGLTCKPIHDHRFGLCTLPEAATSERALLSFRREGCHWAGTAAYWRRRPEGHGYREWSDFRRQDRRRSRQQARHGLHTCPSER
jgi:hypothetical protein